MRDTKNTWKLILAANIGIILWFWWQGAASLLADGGSSALLAFGRLAGLAAALTVLLQFLFMGRLPWLEKSFGLDNLSRIHHTNGLLSFWFIICHPILITWAYVGFSGLTVWEQVKSLLFDFDDVAAAAVGTLLFLLVVFLSITIVRKRLAYELWYFVHLLVYLALFASFGHQLELGHDFSRSQIFYGYWLLLYAAVLGTHVVFRFVRPLYFTYKHQFRVERIKRENHNVVSLYIGGRDMKEFFVQSGQFMVFRFLDKQRWWQAHPFSLSFAPNGKELRITVKEVGDFTKQLHGVAPGTRVLIEGPYGVFTESKANSSKVLFIAGGIGITPIRSLWEKVAAKKKSVTLLYGAQTKEDIVLKEELQDIAGGSLANIIPVLSDDPTYDGEKGYIDKEKIERLVPDVASYDIFICGPGLMMNSVIAALKELGVPKHRIHYEKFSLG